MSDSTHVQNRTKMNNPSFQKFVTNFLLKQIQSEMEKQHKYLSFELKGQLPQVKDNINRY